MREMAAQICLLSDSNDAAEIQEHLDSMKRLGEQFIKLAEDTKAALKKLKKKQKCDATNIRIGPLIADYEAHLVKLVKMQTELQLNISNAEKIQNELAM